MRDSSGSELSRRQLIRHASVGAGALLLGGGTPLLAACSSGLKSSSGSSTGTITIGYVSPQTGSLAGFASADSYVISQIRSALSKGVTIGGKKYDINIVVKDSQSTVTRAAQVAQDLVNSGADIVLASATPDTVNPVASQCEAGGVPNVGTISPWEAWYYRSGTPTKAFTYSTFFFFGMAQFTELFIGMWKKFSTDKDVAVLWPNDTDANAFRAGFPPAMKTAGYSMVDGGKYTDGTTDYTAQITTFKNGNAELFTCAPVPPDFNLFWKQAAQQGYKPKLATVAKVLLFPADTAALGSLVENVATDCWWSPYHPYVSSLTGETAKDLAAGFTTTTGNQWTQALGSVYSLFEVAYQALTKAGDPHDRKAVASELRSMKITGMSGELDFTAGPVPGVAVQKIVGAQWRTGTSGFPYSMYVVDNDTDSAVPTNGQLLATNA
jgi:branched-chain amino acid transport system substrate-binding protein